MIHRAIRVGTQSIEGSRLQGLRVITFDDETKMTTWLDGAGNVLLSETWGFRLNGDLMGFPSLEQFLDWRKSYRDYWAEDEDLVVDEGL